MGLPYRARVNERVFLNLSGFHGGAYVSILELPTDSRAIEFTFDVDSEEKTCEFAAQERHAPRGLRVFRQGLMDEFEPYDRRQRDLEASRE